MGAKIKTYLHSTRVHYPVASERIAKCGRTVRFACEAKRGSNSVVPAIKTPANELEVPTVFVIQFS